MSFTKELAENGQIHEVAIYSSEALQYFRQRKKMGAFVPIVLERCHPPISFHNQSYQVTHKPYLTFYVIWL